VLTLASIEPLLYIVEKAQTKPLLAGVMGVALAAIYGALNWPFASERTARAADAAFYWRRGLDLNPHQETAVEIIEQARRDYGL